MGEFQVDHVINQVFNTDDFDGKYSLKGVILDWIGYTNGIFRVNAEHSS